MNNEEKLTPQQTEALRKSLTSSFNMAQKKDNQLSATKFCERVSNNVYTRHGISWSPSAIYQFMKKDIQTPFLSPDRLFDIAGAIRSAESPGRVQTDAMILSFA